MISFESSSSKYGKNSKDLFKKHANKNKTKIKKGHGLSQFNPKLHFKSDNNDKLNIYKKSPNNKKGEQYNEDSSDEDNRIVLSED